MNLKQCFAAFLALPGPCNLFSPPQNTASRGKGPHSFTKTKTLTNWPKLYCTTSGFDAWLHDLSFHSTCHQQSLALPQSLDSSDRAPGHWHTQGKPCPFQRSTVPVSSAKTDWRTAPANRIASRVFLHSLSQGRLHTKRSAHGSQRLYKQGSKPSFWNSKLRTSNILFLLMTRLSKSGSTCPTTLVAMAMSTEHYWGVYGIYVPRIKGVDDKHGESQNWEETHRDYRDLEHSTAKQHQ